MVKPTTNWRSCVGFFFVGLVVYTVLKEKAMKVMGTLFILTMVSITISLIGCGGGGGGDGTTYTITASAGSEGIISPSGAVTVQGGGSKTFTATPNSGYEVNEWLLDQGTANEQILTYYTGNTTCTLNNIQQNHTLRVTFKQPDEPNATFTITPSSGDTITTFTFNAAGCTDPQDDVALLQVRWDWTNDGVWDTSYSTTKTTTHTYATGGTYTVKLEVMDTDANTSTATRTVAVNSAPTASFTLTPSSGDTTTTFTVNASGCSDLQDTTSALQVRWDWTNDGTWDTSYSTTKTATHSYGTANDYTIKLEVKDTGGLTATTTRSVTVTSAPSAAFTITPTSGTTGTEFLFDASSCTDTEDLTSDLQVQWDWTNNGSYDTTYTTTKTAYHTYSSAGTYTVKLRVKDTDGMTGTITHTVSVTATTAPSAISDFGTESYVPGTPLSVSTVVTPLGTTQAYAVEDAPPTGWTVSNINQSGVYDAVNHKVKWGPFFDSTARTFTYTATPPGGTTGVQVFTGTASLDGSNVTIAGDRHIMP